MLEHTESGKKYIGQSINAETRLKQHLWAANRKEPGKLYNAIRKYGIDAFEHTILVKDINPEVLDLYEEAFILVYQSKEFGYNLTDGGGSIRGFEFSTKTRNKMKENNAKGGNPMAKTIIRLDTLEVFECIVDAALVMGVCPQAIGDAIKKRQASGGVYWCLASEMVEGGYTNIPNNKLNKVQSKGVINVTDNILYLSIREAERCTGIARSTISKCIAGVYSTAGGKKWAKAGGKVVQGLLNRRREEKALFERDIKRDNNG